VQDHGSSCCCWCTPIVITHPLHYNVKQVIQLKKEGAARPGSPRKGLPGSPRRGPGSPTRRSVSLLRHQAHPVGDARHARWMTQLQIAAAVHQGQPPAAAAPQQPRSPRSAAIEQLRRHSSTRRLQRLWREFAAQKKTTRALAAAFVESGVTDIKLDAEGRVIRAVPVEPAAPAVDDAAAAGAPAGPVFVGGVLGSGQSLPQHERFEVFAEKLQSQRTLRAAGALLRRLEERLAARGASLEGAQVLLKRLFPSAAAGGKKVERYPVRVALVAYMIRAHPEVVFNKVVSPVLLLLRVVVVDQLLLHALP